MFPGDPQQKGHIDVGPADDHSDMLSQVLELPGPQGSDTHCTAALNHQMMALQSKSHSSPDLLFGDQNCLVDGFLEQFESVFIGYDPTGEGISKSRFLHNFDESAGA
jgi:hypothetical protein